MLYGMYCTSIKTPNKWIDQCSHPFLVYFTVYFPNKPACLPNISDGMYKKKEASIIVDYQCFFSVGVTGFEPATTRPPDAYSNRAELHPAAQLRCKRHASEQVKACFYFQRAQLSFAIAVQRYGFFFTTQTFSYFFSSFSTKIANFVEKCNRDRCT